MTDIRRQIADKRAERVGRLGAEEGFSVPLKRTAPLTNFGSDPLLICEVKRKSPSKGHIKDIPDAAAQAGMYRKNGAGHVSVLTEPDYFGGSLEDLMKVKKACPDLAVLRKDFLLTTEDIEVSYRAGADACLLICSLLELDQLKKMHDLCLQKGMTPLVEVHSQEDVAKAAMVKPTLVGINSRDLRNFRIYPLQPLKIRSLIHWECRIIYESGILKDIDGDFAVDSGFEGLLVGEGVVRDPGLIGLLKKKLLHAAQTKTQSGKTDSWTKLCNRYRPGRPLIKICGLTRKEDYEMAVSLGADMTGFILASSPRQTNEAFIRSLPASDVLKVGVVVLKEGETLPPEISAMLEEGILDMLQFHGSELPETVRGRGYKALRIKEENDLDKISDFNPLPCLLDAFSPDLAGGTGKRLEPRLVKKAREKGELWLAGGLNPQNIRDILETYKPELIDLSSGLEDSPGIKDQVKMKHFFREIEHYAAIS